MNFARDLQAELTRITVFWAAVELIAFIVAMAILYLVIKAAVRDGINESKLGQRTAAWQTPEAAQRASKAFDELRID